ncbi:Cha4p [Sugiyamaella lignohabitans]|uniref:Cha4p n=1 Tax=Sugiyamaella lignohabitans TaxID=796027 RepID=A0A167F289_9ASCO|nr:Cha4p [Sugiyamaella lignohabitans]ANB14732.1 Cha4p [Sugiyamaella lignohabitans]
MDPISRFTPALSAAQMIPGTGPIIPTGRSSTTVTPPADTSSDTATAPKKRSVISLACSTCRKRKTKCDGRKPACSQCLNTGRPNECVYDVNADRRRSWHSRQNKVLMEKLSAAEALIKRIRNGGKDCEDAIREIQSGSAAGLTNGISIDVSVKTESISGADTTYGKASSIANTSESNDGPDNNWKEDNDLTLDEEGQVHFFGGTSNLPEIKQSLTVSGRTHYKKSALQSLLNEEEPRQFQDQRLLQYKNGPTDSQSQGMSLSATSPVMSTSPTAQSGTNLSNTPSSTSSDNNYHSLPPLSGPFYTAHNVDIPTPIVHHLLDLYFCWQHSYYNIFNAELFLRDLQTGGKFYSKFLLNAVLAHASQLSNVQLLRSDPSDPSTAGYMFFNEARSQIEQELLKRSVTTIQGLLLLASREAGIGRDTVGWVYSGMAFRMAVDLGLHLDCKSLCECGFLTHDDYIVRNATFWGCYLFDQGWSTYMGRPSVIHLSDVTVSRPEFIVNEQPTEWRPVFNSPTNLPIGRRIVGSPVPFYPQNTLTSILRLSEVIEDIQKSLYSPKRSLKRDGSFKIEEKVKEIFHKLASWEENLPIEMKRGPGSEHPSVLLVYTLYYATKIFLFRPFVQVKESQSAPGPNHGAALEQCLDAAANIVARLKQFKARYTLRLATNMSVYISFTAATISLSKPGDDALAIQLNECLEFLKEIGESWTSANTVGEGIKARLTATSQQAGHQTDATDQLLFPTFAIGTPNFLEAVDLLNYDNVPEFEFLMSNNV